MRKKPVKLVKCKTVDIEVPADAEIILEGYVDLHEERIEGPFGDHTGYYSAADKYPVFHVTCMTHRKDPVYPATIVGKPPQEDCYMGKATEQIFLPVLRQILPEIVDMNLPFEGVFHNCAIISINKSFAGHANKVINAVWGLGQMMFTKFVIVVDSDVDVHDISTVSWKILIIPTLRGIVPLQKALWTCLTIPVICWVLAARWELTPRGSGRRKVLSVSGRRRL